MESDQLANILRASFAIGSVIVAIFLYRLNRQLRKDAWARTLRDFHQFFWDDDDCREVRSWIACNASYLKILPVLQKRRACCEIAVEEYSALEKIDKFFALLATYRMIEEKHTLYVDVSERVFDDYWITGVYKHDDLHWYVNEFFREVLKPREKPWPVKLWLSTKQLMLRLVRLQRK